jgi:ABC-2 type transport system ATP-binding protein
VSRAIEVDHLVVQFGTTVAVSDVSLNVEFGEIAAVLGPNGAGKTTLVETTLGFRSPNAGTARVLGRDPVADHQLVVASTGALLQRAGVWFPMSPRDALRLTASYYPAPRPVHELLDELGLHRCATTPWRRLSGGEQQRTLLALALVGRPRVLFLDEPTSAVDPAGHREVRELIHRERERGCAILLTTHDLRDAEELASHVTLMDRGRVVAAGTPRELAGDDVVVVESSVPIDAASLATTLGVAVTEDGPRCYRIATASNPTVVAAVSAAIEAAGGSMLALRTRATLEETYLRLLEHEEPQ